MPLHLDIDGLLRKTVERKLQGPSNLVESIQYSLFAPGKRIRPRLAIACGQMLGLPKTVTVPSGLALEMIHCFTLIHDDLPCMDDDDYRRGMPSNHKKFGEGLALLAGDALIPLAIETYLECAVHSPLGFAINGLRRMMSCVGAKGVIGGQAAEMLLGESSTLQDLRSMHAMKTGALFSASVLIPKDLAGIDDASPHGMALQLFAKELGEAFQIADDLDDRAQDEEAPTSILHYVSAQEARTMARRKLEMANQGIISIWKEKSDALIALSNQVLKLLESPSPSSHEGHA